MHFAREGKMQLLIGHKKAFFKAHLTYGTKLQHVFKPYSFIVIERQRN